MNPANSRVTMQCDDVNGGKYNGMAILDKQNMAPLRNNEYNAMVKAVEARLVGLTFQ